MSVVAAGQHQEIAAVELASGAAALRALIGVPIQPIWQADLEQTLAKARAALGQEALDAAWTRGWQRPLAGLIATTKEINVAAPGHGDRSTFEQEADRLAHLSERELDVMRLLVDGKSDREIGDTLFISHRTASKHVSNILAKLEIDSRGEAAVIAVRHDLV
jgi:DNA-binding NarL/FixJ family response regulator